MNVLHEVALGDVDAGTGPAMGSVPVSAVSDPRNTKVRVTGFMAVDDQQGSPLVFFDSERPAFSTLEDNNETLEGKLVVGAFQYDSNESDKFAKDSNGDLVVLVNNDLRDLKETVLQVVEL